MPVTRIIFIVPLKQRQHLARQPAQQAFISKSARREQNRERVGKVRSKGKGWVKKNLSPFFCLPQARSFARSPACLSLVRFVLLEKEKKRLLYGLLARLLTFPISMLPLGSSARAYFDKTCIRNTALSTSSQICVKKKTISWDMLSVFLCGI